MGGISFHQDGTQDIYKFDGKVDLSFTASGSPVLKAVDTGKRPGITSSGSIAVDIAGVTYYIPIVN